MGVKQGETVAHQPHLSLVVPLPIEHDTLLALQETIRRAFELFAAHYDDTHSGHPLGSAASIEILLLQASAQEPVLPSPLHGLPH